jgi:hypothetical protein
MHALSQQPPMKAQEEISDRAALPAVLSAARSDVTACMLCPDAVSAMGEAAGRSRCHLPAARVAVFDNNSHDSETKTGTQAGPVAPVRLLQNGNLIRCTGSNRDPESFEPVGGDALCDAAASAHAPAPLPRGNRRDSVAPCNHAGGVDAADVSCLRATGPLSRVSGAVAMPDQSASIPPQSLSLSRHLETGLIQRCRAALLATGTVIVALLSAVRGLFHEDVTRERYEAMRLSYLAVPTALTR